MFGVILAAAVTVSSGPTCEPITDGATYDQHRIQFDAVPGAVDYVYWFKTVARNPFVQAFRCYCAAECFDPCYASCIATCADACLSSPPPAPDCPAVCVGSCTTECRCVETCDVLERRPAPGVVVFTSLTSRNAAGVEGPH